MDLLSGRPFWPIKNGLPATYPPLARAERCDFVIVGGGITGACLAHDLTAAGLDTVVVDRRDIGTGSTAGSTSLLQYDLDTPMTELAARIGEERAARCHRICAAAVERIATLAAPLPRRADFRRRESLCGASTREAVAALRAEGELRRRHGLSAVFWDRARVAAESSLPFPAALVSRPAAEVDAHALTHGLLRGAVGRGARVYDRTTVLDYRPSRPGVVLRTDRGVAIRARGVIVAAGYEAESFLHQRATRLHSTFALVSEPLADFPGWPGRRLIWETARPYYYLRTTPDRRVIIGGADEPFTSVRRRDHLLPAKTRLLLRQFHRYFPRRQLEPAYAWAGTFAVTDDGLPFIGAHPDFPRTWFALGYGGNGITFSVVAAGIIRDLCLGRKNEDAPLFRFGR